MSKKFEKITTADGFISTHPLPTSEELKGFYAESYYQAPQATTYQQSYDALELNYKRMKCESIMRAIEQTGRLQGNTFLDIGAGEGFLLNAAAQQGFDVTGLDFSAYGVAKFFPQLSAKHIAGDIFESLESLIVQNKKFSVCTSTNVLEHVIDADLFLKLAKKVLAPEGVLLITVPNDYSSIQQLALNEEMIDREFWFVPPHHLHYFNTDNLIPFIESRGFDVIDAFSDFPVDLYLLHPDSNYVKNPSAGREANRARMHHDLMLVQKNGLDKYLDYYRAMFKVGLGRDISIIARLS
jgi:2-polyprenyl-3-methyl-5-hydroxy-6-metoxy-1,4-benzoquinol methylase